jgi:hypothetical protein
MQPRKEENEMMRRLFNLRNLVAISAVAAIALGLAQSDSRRSAASATNVDDLNLRAETQVIESFINDFVTYNKECAQLGRKQNLLNTEVDGVERKAQGLQQRLSNVQNAARTIISKLKAANKWDTLNQDIVARASDPRHKAFFHNINFKAEIEEAAATFGSRGKDVSLPVDNLRRKVAASSGDAKSLMVRALYSLAVPVSSGSLACTAGKLMIGACHAAGQKVPDIVLDFTSCACSPPCPGCNHGITGSYDCSDLGFGAAR